MDEEFAKRLADYFTGPELLSLVEVPMEILVELLEEYILENEEELNDFMSYGK